MKFRCIVIMLFTVCTVPLIGMKQIKLIRDVMKHKNGINLIGHAIGISKDHVPYYTDAPAHILVQLLKKHGKTLYPELMKKRFGSGGITAAHLVYPCPDTFMRTIAPLLHETDSGEILIVEHQDKQIQEHLEQQDYEGLALELPEVFLGIDVYQKRNMDIKKMYCAGEAILHFYNFDSIEHVTTRNPALFKAIRHEQQSEGNRLISSPIQEAYIEAKNVAEDALWRYIVEARTTDGKDIYTCAKEHVDDYLNERLWDKKTKRYTVHKEDCSQHQHQILCKMHKDPRRFITFRHNAQTLKEHVWDHNCQTDQSIIEEWGGIDIHSVIEPNNEAYNLLMQIDDFMLHVPAKNNKALIENSQLCCASTHEGDLCYNPERASMIKEQHEKDEKDYAIIKRKAPRLLDLNYLKDNPVIIPDEANILEECGFYGIQGLHER